MPIRTLFHSQGNASNGLETEAPSFREILEREGLAVTQRHGFGKEIKGACGQLAGK